MCQGIKQLNQSIQRTTNNKNAGIVTIGEQSDERPTLIVSYQQDGETVTKPFLPRYCGLCGKRFGTKAGCGLRNTQIKFTQA